MLGLAVLFFLGLWVIITIVAMVISSKFGRKPATKLLGAFLGFMLTMGGLIVYWTIEYIQIQRTVTRLCETEGGIKVYATPEEWRKQIGEKKWEQLPKYTVFMEGDTDNEQYILFHGNKFRGSIRNDLSNKSLSMYDHYSPIKNISSNISRHILANSTNHSILVEGMSVNTGVGSIENNILGLKFWLNDVEDCDFSYQIFNKFSQYNSGVKK